MKEMNLEQRVKQLELQLEILGWNSSFALNSINLIENKDKMSSEQIEELNNKIIIALLRASMEHVALESFKQSIE